MSVQCIHAILQTFSTPQDKSRYIQTILKQIGACDSVKSSSLELFETIYAIVQYDLHGAIKLKSVKDFYIKKNIVGDGLTLRVKKASLGLIEAWGQFDIKAMERIENEHPLDRRLVRAVEEQDKLKVEVLLLQGVCAMQQFYLGQEEIDYGDFSRPQHLIALQYYTHSPFMVSIQHESIEMIELLLESRPFTSHEALWLFRYAIDTFKLLSLSFLLHRKGYPHTMDLKYDLIEYAKSRRALDAVSIMTKERDSPGHCSVNWVLIGGV